MRGQVQGVGFRPFVWQLAQRFGVSGDVRNDAEGVLIQARGGNLEGFEAALTSEAPALSSVDAVESVDAEIAATDTFVIAASGPSGAETRVTPDAATCADCVAEIADPDERRHGYAFANCTNCGPRFTILNALPYDRAQTTMAPFTMCDACQTEYDNPADRRFHAQPIACPDCGPRLWFEQNGAELAGDPISCAVDALAAGKILAIKGLGGFHLCCSARNGAAVAELRSRKRRPSKPFALMANLDGIAAFAQVSDAERALLTSAAAPVVLLNAAGLSLPEVVAPGMARLGFMLPYTPLHHLLLASWEGGPLVMTSGNLSGEPQVVGNQEAREKLSTFADGFLMHDREIARRLDDGVEMAGPAGPVVLRRARGRVPGILPVPDRLCDAQVVAFGGQLKSAICLTKNGQALLSHHLGDLDDALSVAEFVKADEDMSDLFDHHPEAVAVDLHPGFRATQHGCARAEDLGLPLIEVQHHHAHMAAALGEAGWAGETAVGIVLDGLGLGTDGTIWGGEVLVGGYEEVGRAGYLKPAPLVGGDRAQAEPWRNAVMRLDGAGLGDWADRLFPDQPRDAVRQAAAAGINAPVSSSVGRLFDAVAACLGLAATRQSFEGEAAMRLEALAANATGTAGAYPHGQDGKTIDPAPMFAALVGDLGAGVEPATIAARFHGFVTTAFAGAAREAAAAQGTDQIALSGGCFQNLTLLSGMVDALSDLRVAGPGMVPANDGGLAYGQALVALSRLESNRP